MKPRTLKPFLIFLSILYGSSAAAGGDIWYVADAFGCRTLEEAAVQFGPHIHTPDEFSETMQWLGHPYSARYDLIPGQFVVFTSRIFKGEIWLVRGFKNCWEAQCFFPTTWKGSPKLQCE